MEDMDNRIELLAPAGSMESLIAAVQNGADAVYLGGKKFNARNSASNFDEDLIEKAIDYAHIRDVKTYLAMNTLLLDDELKGALEFISGAYKMGIDGIIVQDVGLASLIRKYFPELELHASTQMTVYNIEGIKTLEKMGFKRVVLARELPLTDINDIVKNTNLEIEIFIHGALCISYSGQCLMSSFIGGRSGNRGTCAQPCRLPYDLYEVKNNSKLNINLQKYLLSPKDISSLEILDKVVLSGVKSLKIEGRMRSPEYVATVVSTYRKYLDQIYSFQKGKADLKVNRDDLKNLAQVFNRGGLSSGYLNKKTGKDMMSYEKPKNWGIFIGKVLDYNKGTSTFKIKLEEDLAIGDGMEVWNGIDPNPGFIVSELMIKKNNIKNAKVNDIVEIGRVKSKINPGDKVYKTLDKKLNSLAKESYLKENRKVELDCEIKILTGKPVELEVKDSLGNNIALISEKMPEAAVNKSLTRDKVEEQIKKTGSTPFEFKNINIDLEENLAVSAKELNELRRSALEKMEGKRAGFYKKDISFDSSVYNDCLTTEYNNIESIKNTKISAFFYRIEKDFKLSDTFIDRVYIPFKTIVQKDIEIIIESLRLNAGEIFLWLPNITRGNYDIFITRNKDKLLELDIDGLLIGNLNSVEFFSGSKFNKFKLTGDYSLNVTNFSSVRQLEDMGLESICISSELNLKKIKRLCGFDKIKKEVLVYGKMPLMTSEYCPVGSIGGNFTNKSNCKGICKDKSYVLKDRMGVYFEVLCDNLDCRSIILNSKPILIYEDLPQVISANTDYLRLNFYNESINDINLIVKSYRNIITEVSFESIKNSNIEDIKIKEYTKGHFFRGI